MAIRRRRAAEDAPASVDALGLGEVGGGVAVLDHAALPSQATVAEKERSSFQRISTMEITPKRIKRKDLMHFSRQLAVFIKAGIPIIEALATIREEVTHKYFRQVLDDSIESLRAGATFSGSLQMHSAAFPEYYLGILRSSELSGHLDSSLRQLSEYIERDLEARRKVVSALTYPAIVLLMSVGVVCVLTIYVLPKFVTFFDSLDAKLPLATRMLINTSRFITHHWYLWAALAGLILLVALWMIRAERGRSVRDTLTLKLPILGDLVQHAIIERFCRILSAMVEAGVTLPEALLVTTDATGNAVYRNALRAARDATMRGEGLAAPLAATGLFPGAARQMLRVGEETGSLDEQLATAAEYYERELDYRIKRFTNLFEPVVIVAVGFVVGFVAIALISAMYGIFRQSSL